MINPSAKVLLDIRGLTATVAGVTILKGIDLTVRAGEVHAIMGPNGSGKSTLAKVLAGHPAYAVTGGTVQFEGKDLFALAAEERARAGLFLGFQYPVEIPGVSNSSFLRLAYNTARLTHWRAPVPTSGADSARKPDFAATPGPPRPGFPRRDVWQPRSCRSLYLRTCIQQPIVTTRFGAGYRRAAYRRGRRE